MHCNQRPCSWTFKTWSFPINSESVFSLITKIDLKRVFFTKPFYKTPGLSSFWCSQNKKFKKNPLVLPLHPKSKSI